jgi:hypothetical protein
MQTGRAVLSRHRVPLALPMQVALPVHAITDVRAEIDFKSRHASEKNKFGPVSFWPCDASLRCDKMEQRRR